MKWRVIILLLTGIATIYFVSLLQDTPYPHPLTVEISETDTASTHYDQTLLNMNGDYMYKTQVLYEYVLPGKQAEVYGISPLKIGVYGYIVQYRKKMVNILSQDEGKWELCFQHTLGGSITQTSRSTDHSPLQFGVLYHLLKDDNIQHLIRVYYIPADSTVMEFKDVLLPGQTMISTFNLEEDSILFTRDPDIYRYRIAALPDITSAPHSTESQLISLNTSVPGDPIRAYHQPIGTEAHENILCKLYSPNPDLYRVFTLDTQKTKRNYHSNVTIADGIAPLTHGNNQIWIRREQWSNTNDIYIDETLEYMAFVDGAHFHQERTEINMPKSSFSRSADGKTLVASLIRNSFITMDFSDNIDRLLRSNTYQNLFFYKDLDGEIMKELYHSMQDDVLPSETTYDITDIKGIEVNKNGTLLAIWTESNSVYVYKRGSGDRVHNDNNVPGSGSPHHLDRQLDWILRMVITPKEGQYNPVIPVGASMFWEMSGSNYISIALKNNAVYTYYIDQAREQKAVNFHSFIRDRWDLWFAMSTIVTLFTLNEYKSYSL